MFDFGFGWCSIPSHFDINISLRNIDIYLRINLHFRSGYMHIRRLYMYLRGFYM